MRQVKIALPHGPEYPKMSPLRLPTTRPLHVLDPAKASPRVPTWSWVALGVLALACGKPAEQDDGAMGAVTAGSLSSTSLAPSPPPPTATTPTATTPSPTPTTTGSATATATTDLPPDASTPPSATTTPPTPVMSSTPAAMPSMTAMPSADPTDTPAPSASLPSPDAGVGGGGTLPPEPVVPGSDCGNGAKDGNEAGVDCGGDCEQACVQYVIDKPNPENEDRSGCEANGNGFMCPRAMLLSPEMQQAAFDDWGGDEAPFAYGVVGHDPDPGGVDDQSASYSSTCCQCYQLVYKGPRDGGVSVPLPKPLIVQAFNTYAGGPSAFDVYMAVGGHGNFNGCTENGRLYAGYPDTGGDWSGGARATRYSQCGGEMGYTEQTLAAPMCQDFVAQECSKIQTAEAYQATAQQSCVLSNRPESHYHMNWNVVVKRVECPVALTRVTGCQLGDQGLPKADPAIQTVEQAMQNGFKDSDYHTTTMEDCCRPTCAWPTNVSGTTDGWSRFYTCDGSGGVD